MTRTQWIESCQRWKTKWPVIQQQYLPGPEDQALNINTAHPTIFSWAMVVV